MDALCVRNVSQLTLYDRISKLMETYEWSDCSFRVGSETIRAHKLILAISSPVFKVMLYGPLAERKEIVISDIEPHIFQLLLDFIYKDKVYIDSLENSCGLLYAAKKYMLPYLIKICLKYIENSLSIHNVLTILNFAEWIQEDSLVIRCIDLICKHTDVVFTLANEHISGSCLRKILQRESLNVSEKDLIDIAVQWAHDECLKQDLSLCDENKRMLLLKSDNLNLLRFFTLSIDDMDWLNSLGILTKEEFVVLKHNLSQNVIPKDQAKIQPTESNNQQLSVDLKIMDLDDNYKFILNLATIPRSLLRLDWLYCCRPIIRTATPLIITNTYQNIKVRIKSQKTIFVNSISVPTRQSPEDIFVNESPLYAENLNLVIYSNTDNKQHISAKYMYKTRYNSTTYIHLPKPFIFNEEDWYTVSFTWPEVFFHSYKYPLCYRPMISSDNIFMFDDNFENTMPCGSFVEGLKFCI
ncbi:BTB/POZ domain-containing protein 2-like [Arctopsyche grandis]|uniref:BTB/POZ domain-containing protein 2-like n=1 Tax=Arctopsyche grandis TaxID=121162 RepID=UPI00406D6ED5